MKLYDRIFPPRVLELSNGKQVLKYRSRAPLGVLAVVLLTALSVKVTGFDMGILAARIREFFILLTILYSKSPVTFVFRQNSLDIKYYSIGFLIFSDIEIHQFPVRNSQNNSIITFFL